MPDTECFVCRTSLALFDEDAANFHLNACLDGSAATVAPVTDSIDASSGPSSEGIFLLPHPSISNCPVCDKEFPRDDLQDHVETCLVASQASGQKRAGSSNEENSLVDQSTNCCPCCLLEWTAIDIPSQERELHVADCLSQVQALREDDEEDEDSLEIPSETRLQTVLGKLNSNGFGKLRTAWKGKGEHTSVTPNLVPLLQSMLERSSATRLAVLCTTKVEHIKSQFGDFGWGCGYKSACMVFSALRHVQQYRNMLLSQQSKDEEVTGAKEAINSGKRKQAPDAEEAQDAPAIPTIEELQHIAEAAWTAGFDPDGKLHFKGKLVGSRRWIGTSEVYTMFTWLGIRTTIVDFPKIAGGSGAHSVLSKWVFDYFKARIDVAVDGKDAFGRLMNSNGSSVRIREDRMPLYLQHQGHSRVIVGVEQTNGGELNLLVFDCGKKIATKLKEATISNLHKKQKSLLGASAPSSSDAGSLLPKLLDPYRVNLKSLSKKDEYQILRIETEGGPLTAKEKLARREITSLRVTD